MLLSTKYNSTHSFQHKAAQHLVAQNLTYKILHIFDGTGRKELIDSFLKSNSNIWKLALSNEIGKLAQGIRDVKGNGALDFVHKSTIPTNKK